MQGYLTFRIIGKTLSTQLLTICSSIVSPSKFCPFENSISSWPDFLFSPSIYRIITIRAFKHKRKWLLHVISLSLSRVASRLLDNPRDLSWLMPGWFLRGGNEERFSNVHKLYRTKPRNGRRAAKSKARSRNRRVAVLWQMGANNRNENYDDICWASFSIFEDKYHV